MIRQTGIIALTVVLWGLLTLTAAAQTSTNSEGWNEEAQRTPPRLSLLEGAVSFWRPGAEDWVAAQVNTPIAPRDQLYVGSDGQMELQIGPAAFFRGGPDTQIGLEAHETGLLHFKVTMGQAAIDLRNVEPGWTIAVDTPNAAFTIQQSGYYRINVDDAHTEITTRNGGRADAILANGETIPIASEETVRLAGAPTPAISARSAPQPDGWDNWNQNRTDYHLTAESARHVSPNTYGLGDLDRHGTWRTVPSYGTVWVPRAVSPDWAPYSSGTWIRDPYYGWTWVDTQPWGWAPFHYGRWVYVQNAWCWAPGPIVRRPVYAPALVAFYGHPGVNVSVSIGGPFVGWVALGWGEPIVPWWGRPGFIHQPWWGGWRGPRVVNNVIIHHNRFIDARHITTYRNSRVRNAVVTVNERHFGGGRSITRANLTPTDSRRLRPTHAAPNIATRPNHFVPTTTRGIRPPDERLNRSVVQARPSSASNLRSTGPADARGVRSASGTLQTPTSGRLQQPPGRPTQQSNGGRSDGQRMTDRATNAPRITAPAVPRRPEVRPNAPATERQRTFTRPETGPQIDRPATTAPAPPRTPVRPDIRSPQRPEGRPDTSAADTRGTPAPSETGSRFDRPLTTAPTPPQAPARTNVRSPQRPEGRLESSAPAPINQPAPAATQHPAERIQTRTPALPAGRSSSRPTDEITRTPGASPSTTPMGIRPAPQERMRSTSPAPAPSRMAPQQSPAGRSG
ncbi:MAG: hypothetical protein KFF50_02670, partial [Desulfatitalea sp.]|nr:hypothetical protein [Desulfatitalea sp.]